MIGTIVNTACILIGSFAGSFLQKKLDIRLQNALYNAMGLVTLALGANMCVVNFSKSTLPVLFIVSIALGAVVGMKLDIAGRIDRYAARHDASKLAQGLTASCLLYCIGTLSIVGPVLSAVYGNNTYLYTNATLDLVTSTIFGATYGVGIAWGALVLFCWQGSIWLVAVPLAFISALVWHLPIHLALLMTRTESLIKVVILSARYKSKKWMNTVIEDL